MQGVHNWNTVNREVLQPSDIFLRDVIEEIRAAFVDDDDPVVMLVEAIDRRHYAKAGKVIADALERLDNA